MIKRTFLFLFVLTIVATANAAPDLAEQEAAKAYDKARTCYQNLMLNESSQKQRDNWEKCMTQFAAIARDYNETAKGADALYTLGKMYRLLSQQSFNKEDAKEAYVRFDEFSDRYKKNRLYDDALYEMACIKLYTFNDDGKAKRLLLKIIRWDPDGDRVGDAKILLAKIKSGHVATADIAPLKPQGAVLQNKPKPLLPVRGEPFDQKLGSKLPSLIPRNQNRTGPKGAEFSRDKLRTGSVEPQIGPSTSSGRTDEEKKSPNP